MSCGELLAIIFFVVICFAAPLFGLFVLLVIVGYFVYVFFKKDKIDKQNQKYENLEEIMEYIDNLSGEEFEEYIAFKILEADDYEILGTTSVTGDFGVDIIAYKNNIKCAIQCKRFNSKVSNKAIQEVVAGRKHYKCEKAIVITNNYFTLNAKKLAEDNKVELLDRNYIINVIKNSKDI